MSNLSHILAKCCGRETLERYTTKLGLIEVKQHDEENQNATMEIRGSPLPQNRVTFRL